MSSSKEDKIIETRFREIHELTRHPGWKHVETMFLDKIAELKNLESLLSYPDEDKLKMMTLHIEVAQRLKEILTEISSASQSHTQESVEPIIVYGAAEFGE